MNDTFLVSITECLACDNQVLKTLGTLQGVFGVEIDRMEERITVTHTDEVSRAEITEKLRSLGFPQSEEEKDEVNEFSEGNDPEKDEPSIWGCAL